MCASDGDRRISSIVDDIFYANPVPSCNNENTILYQILDQAPQARKLMNYVIHLRPSNNSHNRNKNTALKQSLLISQRWREEEKGVNPKMSPATLQLETPVIFSWSRKAHDIKLDQIVKPPNNSIAREPQESTNNRLYKAVTTHLNDIKSIEGPNPADSSTRKKTGWTKTGFKVDPLQPFVATLIKEPKKKAPKKEKTSSKMKNLFGFLSSSGRKEKTQSDPQSPNSNQQNIEGFTDVEKKEQEPIQEQEQESTSAGDTIQEVSLSSRLAIKSTEPTNAPSPLSMDSFIPLQPRKRK